jgi:hypothetical protein
MIVHYQAAVQKDLFESSSKEDLIETFKLINQRLGKTFEFPGFWKTGVHKGFKWFFISDELKNLIGESVEYDNVYPESKMQSEPLDLPFMKNFQDLLTILGEKKFMEFFNKTGEELVEAGVKKFVSDWKQTLDAAEKLISKHFEDKAKSETEGESPVDPKILALKEYIKKFFPQNKQKPMEVPNPRNHLHQLDIKQSRERLIEFINPKPTKQKQKQEPNQYEYSDVSAEEERAINEIIKDYGQQLKEPGFGDPERASDSGQFTWPRH